MDILCKKCNLIKKHLLRKNGNPQAYCRDCQREYNKLHYKKNKEAHIKRAIKNKKRRLEKVKKLVANIKSIPCKDCKNVYPSYVMQFDHINNDKEFNISDALNRYSLDRILNEMAKCEIVCSNCHAIRTHNRR